MSKEKLIPELRFPEFENDGSWENVSLEDVADIIKGKQLNRLQLSESGTYPCLNGGISPSGYTDKFNTKANTITISEGGNSCGFVSYMTTKFWLGGHCYKIDLKKSTSLEFFYQLLKANELRIKRLRVGSGLPNIQKGTLLSLRMPFVSNPDEQQKIASCLSSLDELIAAHNDKLDALKDHKKGLLQNLFPQEGETVPKVRFPEFEGDGEWVEKELSEVSTIITGSTPSTKVPEYYGGDIMFVSPADISNNKYVESTEKTLSLEGFEKTRKIKANSVMFVCIGSTIGKVAMNKFECATNQQINSLVPNNENSSDFLYSNLELNAFKISGIAGNQAVPIINKTLFSSVKLKFPPTKEEQQKIASCLSAVDELITAQQEKIEQLQQHKKGLMQGLFPKIES